MLMCGGFYPILSRCRGLYAPDFGPRIDTARTMYNRHKSCSSCGLQRVWLPLVITPFKPATAPALYVICATAQRCSSAWDMPSN